MNRSLIFRHDKLARTNPFSVKVKILKRQIKSRIRRNHIEHGKDVFQSKNSKNAWKFIRSSTFTVKKGHSLSLDINSLNTAFADAVSDTSLPCDADPHPVPVGCDTYPSFNFRHITSNEVYHLLSTLNVESASGHDNLSCYLIKKYAKQLTSNITILFNVSISQSIFPDSWKKANISAI